MAKPGFSTDGPTVSHQTSIRIVAVKALNKASFLLCGFYKTTEFHRIELFISCEQYPGYSTHFVRQSYSGFEQPYSLHHVQNPFIQETQPDRLAVFSPFTSSYAKDGSPCAQEKQSAKSDIPAFGYPKQALFASGRVLTRR